MLFENTFRLSTRIESNQKYLDTLNTYVAVQLINKERCFTEQNMPIWCWLKKGRKNVYKQESGRDTINATNFCRFQANVRHILRFSNSWKVTVLKTAQMMMTQKRQIKKLALFVTVAVVTNNSARKSKIWSSGFVIRLLPGKRKNRIS